METEKRQIMVQVEAPRRTVFSPLPNHFNCRAFATFCGFEGIGAGIDQSSEIARRKAISESQERVLFQYWKSKKGQKFFDKLGSEVSLPPPRSTTGMAVHPNEVFAVAASRNEALELLGLQMLRQRRLKLIEISDSSTILEFFEKTFLKIKSFEFRSFFAENFEGFCFSVLQSPEFVFFGSSYDKDRAVSRQKASEECLRKVIEIDRWRQLLESDDESNILRGKVLYWRSSEGVRDLAQMLETRIPSDGYSEVNSSDVDTFRLRAGKNWVSYSRLRRNSLDIDETQINFPRY